MDMPTSLLCVHKYYTFHVSTSQIFRSELLEHRMIAAFIDLEIKYALGRVIAQAVRRRFLTAEARVHAQSSLGEICCKQVALGQVSLRVFRFSPVSIISPLLHIHSYSIW
jgi:hypothetical protein